MSTKQQGDAMLEACAATLHFSGRHASCAYRAKATILTPNEKLKLAFAEHRTCKPYVDSLEDRYRESVEAARLRQVTSLLRATRL